MSIYREIYNVGVLNDIHHLFPEILYDNIIFPNTQENNILSWIRYRLTRYYPSTFHRNRVEYLRTRAQNTRNDYDDWGFLLNRPSLFVQPNSRRNVIVQEPNIVPITPIQTRLISRSGDALADLITIMLNQTGAFEEAVPIVPTTEQLENATTIVQRNANEPNQSICTICQLLPNESSPQNNEWRTIQSCNHSFHRACIDRWFTQHCTCPVCRVDIRTVSTPQTRLNPNSAPLPSESASLNPSQ